MIQGAIGRQFLRPLRVDLCRDGWHGGSVLLQLLTLRGFIPGIEQDSQRQLTQPDLPVIATPLFIEKPILLQGRDGLEEAAAARAIAPMLSRYLGRCRTSLLVLVELLRTFQRPTQRDKGEV